MLLLDLHLTRRSYALDLLAQSPLFGYATSWRRNPNAATSHSKAPHFGKAIGSPASI